MKPFFRYCLPVVLLLAGYILRLPAQEMDVYKSLIKESIDMSIIEELKSQDTNLNPFTNPTALDASKQYIPRMGYNRELNSLIIGSDDSPVYTISPYVTMPYTNSEDFSAVFAALEADHAANKILTPLVAIAKLDIFALARFLMDIGVLPNRPYETKEMKKAKKLKEIKSIYDIE